jgi:hypothetical protein
MVSTARSREVQLEVGAVPRVEKTAARIRLTSHDKSVFAWNDDLIRVHDERKSVVRRPKAEELTREILQRTGINARREARDSAPASG